VFINVLSSNISQFNVSNASTSSGHIPIAISHCSASSTAVVRHGTVSGAAPVAALRMDVLVPGRCWTGPPLLSVKFTTCSAATGRGLMHHENI
jgi:hypothetical protein